MLGVWRPVIIIRDNISLSENKTLQTEQIKMLELRLTGRYVLVILQFLPTGYGKSWIYQVHVQVLFGQSFSPQTRMQVC